MLIGPNSEWFGCKLHTTIYSKTNRYRLVFFRPLPPVLARVPGHGLLSLPIPKLPFLAWIRLYFVLCSLLPS